ncbi:MAG: MarR family winged helix-turn-helix transcriptional regulator [Candidatus Merdivicinus sp.]|jgi:DNA-binding MarR family transcriptional regulator
METTFHHLILTVQNTFQKKIVSKAAESDLLPGQSKFLDYLEDHDGCEQKILGEVFHLEGATVTGILQRMEQNGLIERRSQNGNRKSNYVFLTEKGKAACTIVRNIFAEYERCAFSGISSAEQEFFLEILQKIYQNLTKEANN